MDTYSLLICLPHWTELSRVLTTCLIDLYIPRQWAQDLAQRKYKDWRMNESSIYPLGKTEIKNKTKTQEVLDSLRSQRRGEGCPWIHFWIMQSRARWLCCQEICWGFQRGRDDTQTEKQPRFGKANGIFIGHKGEEEEFDSWDREGERL